MSDFLKFEDWIKNVRKSKFILVPNNEDASPRIISEGMCLNKPIFVNENIFVEC